MLKKLGADPETYIHRHAHGDWGDVDAHDKQENDVAICHGERLLSAYNLTQGARLWIITEADRSSTCLLLPEEYKETSTPPRDQYPASVDEVLRPVKYRPEVLAALRAFRAARPWRGTTRVRQGKFRRLHRELCRIYGREVVLRFSGIGGGCSGSSYFMRSGRRSGTIMITGRLSVVTYLHEFAHALGRGEEGACTWSINLFRRIFPRQFARCTTEGHMVRRAESARPDGPRRRRPGRRRSQRT